ncbi:MAG: hypothetical protein J0L93_01160 [Deltaproteobacteria bacterium]|nr:hypothetical protein [Deltaproteobacteria bacterium]
MKAILSLIFSLALSQNIFAQENDALAAKDLEILNSTTKDEFLKEWQKNEEAQIILSSTSKTKTMYRTLEGADFVVSPKIQKYLELSDIAEIVKENKNLIFLSTDMQLVDLRADYVRHLLGQKLSLPKLAIEEGIEFAGSIPVILVENERTQALLVAAAKLKAANDEESKKKASDEVLRATIDSLISAILSMGLIDLQKLKSFQIILEGYKAFNLPLTDVIIYDAAFHEMGSDFLTQCKNIKDLFKAAELDENLNDKKEEIKDAIDKLEKLENIFEKLLARHSEWSEKNVKNNAELLKTQKEMMNQLKEAKKLDAKPLDQKPAVEKEEKFRF